MEVPSIVKIPLEDAQEALSAVGLNTGNITEEYSDEYEAGIVISQKKEAGSKVKKGTSVDFVVSKGKKVKMVNVPRLNNLTEEQALQKLESIGVSGYVVEWRYDNTVTEGYVISQTTSGSVEEGTSVGIVVSLGAQPSDNTQADSGTGD